MKNISNFHTHTHLCHHAEGTPEDYARQAAKEGCSMLGFSDHCPYPERFFDCWPEVRMSVDDVPQYLDGIRRARDVSPFPVYWGFECEYDKDFESWYRDELLGRYGAQYLVLGSHWVTLGQSHVYCTRLSEPSDLNRYIDQTIAGMESGLFAFLAHPDLFMKGYKEWDEQSQACLDALLDAAVDLKIPLEVNGLGMSREPNQTKHGIRYQYPYREFWERVAERGAQVICNSDAHNPLDVLFNAHKARDFAAARGIVPIECPEFAQTSQI